jgi:hypothetical protein
MTEIIRCMCLCQDTGNELKENNTLLAALCEQNENKPPQTQQVTKFLLQGPRLHSVSSTAKASEERCGRCAFYCLDFSQELTRLVIRQLFACLAVY